MSHAAQHQRGVPPRTPRGFLLQGEVRVLQHPLRTGGTPDGPQHRPRRVERRRAVHRNLVERGGVDDLRPTVGLGRLPGEHGDVAGQHRQRWVALDGGVAERREPPLHRGHAAHLVRRQRQLRRQVNAALELGGVQQVLQGDRRGPVGLIPVSGPQMQLGDHLGLDAAELAEQELPEQRVVAVPLPAAVARNHEHAGGLEDPQLRLRAGLAQDGVAQRTTELIEDGGAPQEALRGLRQSRKRFAIQVVGHVPVFAGDGRGIATGVPRDQRGQVQADRPALGPRGHGRRRLPREGDVRRREDLPGTGGVERQVTRQQLLHVARRPQPRQIRLLEPAGRDQLRSTGYAGDNHAQHVVAGRRQQLVHVVQDQHERLGAGPKRRRQPGRRAAQHRDAQAAHVGHQARGARRQSPVGGGQQGQQHPGVVVEPVQATPTPPGGLPLGPTPRAASTSRSPPAP